MVGVEECFDSNKSGLPNMGIHTDHHIHSWPSVSSLDRTMHFKEFMTTCIHTWYIIIYIYINAVNASSNLRGLAILGLSCKVIDNVKGTVISKCLLST